MIKLFITLLILNVLIFADVNGELSIDVQISQIKNAPPNQRVKLMNAFKRRVFQMNNEERSSAIREMQVKMSVSKSRDKMSSDRGMRLSDVREHSSQIQMQSSDDVANYQNMTQQQIKTLITHDKIQRKDGKISKLKIVKQMLKAEKEGQDIRLPNNKIKINTNKIDINIVQEQQKPDLQVEINQQVKEPSQNYNKIP